MPKKRIECAPFGRPIANSSAVCSSLIRGVRHHRGRRAYCSSGSRVPGQVPLSRRRATLAGMHWFSRTGSASTVTSDDMRLTHNSTAWNSQQSCGRFAVMPDTSLERTRQIYGRVSA